MTVGAALVAYAVLMGVVGPVVFARAGWPARAPRLGAGVLLAAGWSVLTALVLAGLTIALPATALSADLSTVLGACVLRLRAAYATPGGAAVAGAGVALTAATLLRVGWSVRRVLRERRTEGRRQRQLVAFVGQRVSGVPATVVHHPVPSAYCLAGGGGTVVITSGAVDLLTAEQVTAVLAHERAHLSARHHLRLGTAAAAGAALPSLPLLRDLHENVRRLLEMHADEIAAREHDPEVLATALVAVASRVPVAALGAAGGDRVMRVRRLLLPPQPLPRRRRMLLRAAAVAVTVAPLLLAGAPAVVAVNQPPLRPAHASAALPPSPARR